MGPNRTTALIAAIGLIVGAVVGCSSDGGATGPAPPSYLPPWNGVRTFEYTIRIDGIVRRAVVHLPETYVHDPRRRLPLLVAFHGSGGSGASMQTQTGLDERADESGFVVAYLDAVGSWVVPCGDCEDGQSDDRDVRFVRRLALALAWDYAVDPDDLFGIGFSAGGGFLHSIACIDGSGLGAIALFSAAVPRAVTDRCPRVSATKAPLLVQVTNGLDDTVVPPEGTQTRLSVAEIAEFWRIRNRCLPSTRIEREPATFVEGSPQILRTSWSECAADARVVLQEVEGAGHAWIRSRDASDGIDYGRVAIRFFGLGLPTTMAVRP